MVGGPNRDCGTRVGVYDQAEGPAAAAAHAPVSRHRKPVGAAVGKGEIGHYLVGHLAAVTDEVAAELVGGAGEMVGFAERNAGRVEGKLGDGVAAEIGH